jgi:ATP-binding cassette subfamily A (ABC1) protein 3
MVASDFSHFGTLLWKCYKLELDSMSKIVWSVVIVLILGAAFGTSAGTLSSSSSGAGTFASSLLPMLLTFFMFFMCGMSGKTIAVNLVRDRKVKFRLTLQLVGVKQYSYLASNLVFAIAWGLLQLVALLGVMTIFAKVSGLQKMEHLIDAEKALEYIVTTVLFLMAFLAMCAAFSGLIKQYDFAGEIIGKFTFLGIFIPLAYMVSTFVNAMVTQDVNEMDKITRFNWKFMWLPNLTYLQVGVKFAIEGSDFFSMLFKTDSIYTFWSILFAQFLGYALIYYFIDRLISSDTGAQRQYLSGTAEDLDDLSDPNDSIEAGSDAQLINRPGFDPRTNSIKVRKLVKKFGDFAAIKGISLDINSGGISCLLGHNGAGKTTLIDIMTGFQVPTEGGVYLNKHNIHKNMDITYGKIGYASSHDPLFDELSVIDFLTLIAKLRGVENPQQEALKVATETHLEPHLYKLIKECSGGTRRRVSISSSIVGNPTIIFLDEPSTGVDPENRRALWEAMSKMRRQDRIILLTTHHLEEAEFLSQDVIIMSKGQISVRGNPEDIKRELGVGYKIVLSDVRTKRDEILSTFTSYQPYFTLNEDKLQSLGELTLEMKSHTGEIITTMLKELERGRYRYTLLASTLEDAFINLGEQDETLEEEKRRDEIIERLFIQKFETDVIHKFFAQLLRKFYLLFKSMLQVIVLLCLVTVPSGIYYVIISAIYGTITQKSHYSEDRLNLRFFSIINIICIIYYTFSCGFFGLIPVTERLTRIRYLMKMNNVSYLSYLPTLIIPDMIIAAALVCITYGVSYLASKSWYDEIDAQLIVYLGLNLFAWMMTFIAQSYFLSFLFSTKESAYKNLTNVILVMNILAYVAVTIFEDTYFEKKYNNMRKTVTLLFDILFPGFSNINYNAKVLVSDEKLNLLQMKEVLSHSGICFAVFFLAAIFMDWKDNRIKRSDTNEMSIPDPSNIMPFDPATVAAEKHEANRDTAELPLQIREVSKMFGTFRALYNVNLALKPGEILGLIGPNGAGKSTLFNIISNYLSPTAGELRYNGKYLDEIPEFYDRTGLCAQDDIIWPELTVDQHLNFYAKLKGVDSETIKLWKELMNLASFGDFTSISLSTGMKRKLCYIISMMTNPTYKFLDEPTSGLDPVSRKLMRKLISAQKRIYGGTCVFTTHTMRDAEDLCDRVAILVNGRLSVVDTVTNLRTKTGGLNVAFMRNLGAQNIIEDERNIVQTFVNTFPDALEMGQPIVIDRTERKIVFFAPNNGALSSRMRYMTKAKADGLIHDFELSQRSLEDLFLFLARNQVGQNKTDGGINLNGAFTPQTAHQMPGFQPQAQAPYPGYQQGGYPQQQFPPGYQNNMAKPF